jgi:hypothetical protein
MGWYFSLCSLSPTCRNESLELLMAMLKWKVDRLRLVFMLGSLYGRNQTKESLLFNIILRAAIDNADVTLFLSPALFAYFYVICKSFQLTQLS